MLNIHDLETRWFKYKLKIFLPYFLLTIFSILLVSIILINYSTDEDKDKDKEISVKPSIIKTPIKIKSIVKESNQTIVSENTKKKLLLAPSLGFINDIQINSPRVTVEKKEYLVPVKKTISKIIPVVTPIEKTPLKQVKKTELLTKTTINIKRQNTQEDIQHVIKRFKQSNNPALSLFIAKKYYELGNYNQAYNYAFITNELNSEIDESWLIFTKSLVKLNEKEKAIEILKKYIHNSHSQRAQVLLKNILSGKLQ